MMIFATTNDNVVTSLYLSIYLSHSISITSEWLFQFNRRETSFHCFYFRMARIRARHVLVLLVTLKLELLDRDKEQEKDGEGVHRFPIVDTNLVSPQSLHNFTASYPIHKVALLSFVASYPSLFVSNYVDLNFVLWIRILSLFLDVLAKIFFAAFSHRFTILVNVVTDSSLPMAMPMMQQQQLYHTTLRWSHNEI